MQTRQSRLVGSIAVLLSIAAAVTAYAMLRAAAWSVELGTLVFVFWAISPYVAFFAAARLLVKLAPVPNLGVASVVIAALMLGFTIYAYLGTMDDASSTASLIFVFIPLYLYIGSFFIMSLVLLISRFIGRKVS